MEEHGERGNKNVMMRHGKGECGCDGGVPWTGDMPSQCVSSGCSAASTCGPCISDTPMMDLSPGSGGTISVTGNYLVVMIGDHM